MTRQFQGVLFDLDGVLVTGGSPLPGALETLNTLLRAGVPFLILTNVTLAPRQAILDRLRRHGLDLPLDRMLTPPAAAARWLRAHDDPLALAVVNPATLVEFEGLNLVAGDAEQAAYVVLGDLGDGWNAAVLNHTLRVLLQGAQLLTLGMGRYWMAPDGLRLDVGAYASALAFASGRPPVVIGKPSPDYFRMALDALGLPPGRVAMVGDDIFNDVQAAQGLGVQGILVQTGKFRAEDLTRGVTPDYVLPAVADILPLLGL